MCGIAGIVDPVESKQSMGSYLDSMVKVIEHRGPDDQGIWVGDGVGLAMRRLSIIDLESGRQPIWNEDATVGVVFNGEIYNYRELTTQLASRGHVFSTNSDTEVLVHLYEEYGEKCLDHLRGMFAFAIWDRRNRRLFVARDRLGIKPLYYHWNGSRLIFASEIKSILEHPDVSAEMDLQSLNDYLTLKYVPAPKTLFEGIRVLPPGHTLTWKDGELALGRYWEVQFHEHPVSISDEQALERLDELLRESIKLRLRSDVPFGAFLSGGIDSSLIVAVMTELLQEPVTTFSVGFEATGGQTDELPYARTVARQFGARHHEVIVGPEDFFAKAEETIWHLEQPIADQATVATLMLSALAREHVKMVLTGEGGDELFAGYARYAGERLSPLMRKIPQAAKRAAIAALRRMPGCRRAKIALYALAQNDEATRFTNWFPLFNHSLKSELVSQTQLKFPDVTETDRVFGAILDRSNTGIPLHRMLLVDMNHWLPDFLLLRGDKLTMAHSIEARVPLLDHKLVEFATSLPPRMKLRGLTRKFLLRKLARRYVPEDVIRRKKQGFPIPIHAWFRGAGRARLRDLLSRDTVARRGLWTGEVVEKLLNEHDNGVADHSYLLWGLASVEIWQQRFIDSTNNARRC
ncbi:MAG: asparagine synthase (glutamine-hydrolyzing) [Myxococcales bacterium]|nr:asparagine synthase (glutamine-hydrolyzing) [Myxococcales bacterium]